MKREKGVRKSWRECLVGGSKLGKPKLKPMVRCDDTMPHVFPYLTCLCLWPSLNLYCFCEGIGFDLNGGFADLSKHLMAATHSSFFLLFSFFLSFFSFKYTIYFPTTIFLMFSIYESICGGLSTNYSSFFIT